MKIVQIAYYNPWPLDTGGNEACYFFLKEIAARHELTLIVPFFSESANEGINKIRVLLPKLDLRAIDCRSGGSFLARAEKRLAVFRKRIARAKAAFRHRFKPSPDSQGEPPIEIVQAVSTLHPSYVKAVGAIDWSTVDLAVVDFAQTLSAVLAIPQSVPRIFINHQIQCVFDDRVRLGAGSQHLSGQRHADYLARWNRLLEGSLMARFDAVIVYSDQDKIAVEREYKLAPVFVSRFPIPLALESAAALIPPDGRTLVFLGGEGHHANRDGLSWFLQEVWPALILVCPTARLRVVGNWSHSFRTRFGNLAQVHFEGFVPNLVSVLRGAVMVVPVRIGSGVRSKILAAMACGAPILTTSVGCEGIPLVDLECARIADTPADFATAAASLLNEPAFGARLAQNAADQVLPAFRPEAAIERRLSVFRHVIESKRQTVTSPTVLN